MGPVQATGGWEESARDSLHPSSSGSDVGGHPMLRDGRKDTDCPLYVDIHFAITPLGQSVQPETDIHGTPGFLFCVDPKACAFIGDIAQLTVHF